MLTVAFAITLPRKPKSTTGAFKMKLWDELKTENDAPIEPECWMDEQMTASLIHCHLLWYWVFLSNNMCKACLNQLLIAIRSSLIVCDQVWSETRLITIIRLIPKPGILCYCCLKTAWKEWVSCSSSTICIGWLPLIDNRNIRRLPSCCPLVEWLLDKFLEDNTAMSLLVRANAECKQCFQWNPAPSLISVCHLLLVIPVSDQKLRENMCKRRRVSVMWYLTAETLSFPTSTEWPTVHPHWCPTDCAKWPTKVAWSTMLH